MLAWLRLVIGGLILAAAAWLILEIREDGARSVTAKVERQNNEAATALIRSALITIPALMLAGFGTSGPGSATALRGVVGTDLIGVRGATPEDKRKIDRTVVGICAAAVWTKAEWQRLTNFANFVHTQVGD